MAAVDLSTPVDSGRGQRSVGMSSLQLLFAGRVAVRLSPVSVHGCHRLSTVERAFGFSQSSVELDPTCSTRGTAIAFAAELVNMHALTAGMWNRYQT